MDIQFPKRTDVGNHTILPGLEMEWLAEGNIASFTLTKPTNQAVQAYFSNQHATHGGGGQRETG